MYFCLGLKHIWTRRQKGLKKMINASQGLVELPKHNGVQLFNQQVTTHVLFSDVCNKVIWY